MSCRFANGRDVYHDDGVTVTRNARIIQVYYANIGVMAYHISDKDVFHFFYASYYKCIYNIFMRFRFRKRRSFSPLHGTTPLLIAAKFHRKFVIGKRKKEIIKLIFIERMLLSGL